MSDSETNLDWSRQGGICYSRCSLCHDDLITYQTSSNSISLTNEPPTPGKWACILYALTPFILISPCALCCRFACSPLQAYRITFNKDETTQEVTCEYRVKKSYSEIVEIFHVVYDIKIETIGQQLRKSDMITDTASVGSHGEDYYAYDIDIITILCREGSYKFPEFSMTGSKEREEFVKLVRAMINGDNILNINAIQ